MRCLALDRSLMATSVRALLGTIFVVALSVLALSVQIRNGHAEAALAFGSDNTGRYWYGTSWDYATREEARGAAMQRCLQKGGHCQVVWQANSGCIALATGDTGNAAGYVSRATKEEAQRVAIRACVEVNKGYACTIRTVFCDNVSEDILRAQREAEQEQKRREAEELQRRQREAAEAAEREEKRAAALREENDQRHRQIGRNAMDCGGGHYCPAGSRCEGGRCVSQAAAQQSNVGNRAPVKTNFDHVVEKLREFAGTKEFFSVLIVGSIVLAFMLLLNYLERRRSRRERLTHEEPKLLQTKLPAADRTPSEKHDVLSVAPYGPRVRARTSL